MTFTKSLASSERTGVLTTFWPWQNDLSWTEQESGRQTDIHISKEREEGETKKGTARLYMQVLLSACPLCWKNAHRKKPRFLWNIHTSGQQITRIHTGAQKGCSRRFPLLSPTFFSAREREWCVCVIARGLIGRSDDKMRPKRLESHERHYFVDTSLVWDQILRDKRIICTFFCRCFFLFLFLFVVLRFLLLKAPKLTHPWKNQKCVSTRKKFQGIVPASVPDIGVRVQTTKPHSLCQRASELVENNQKQIWLVLSVLPLPTDHDRDEKGPKIMAEIIIGLFKIRMMTVGCNGNASSKTRMQTVGFLNANTETKSGHFIFYFQWAIITCVVAKYPVLIGNSENQNPEVNKTENADANAVMPEKEMAPTVMHLQVGHRASPSASYVSNAWICWPGIDAEKRLVGQQSVATRKRSLVSDAHTKSRLPTGGNTTHKRLNFTLSGAGKWLFFQLNNCLLSFVTKKVQFTSQFSFFLKVVQV